VDTGEDGLRVPAAHFWAEAACKLTICAAAEAACTLTHCAEALLGGGLKGVDGGVGTEPNCCLNNNKHAYAGTNDCFTHLRVLLVLQAPWHCAQSS
jgi:hypothetical protein